MVTCKFNIFHIYSECARHCSMCYNETECYECTQGYFLTENGECQSELSILLKYSAPFYIYLHCTLNCITKTTFTILIENGKVKLYQQ